MTTENNVIRIKGAAKRSTPEIFAGSHLFITAKGGVGKSTSACCFIQWARDVHGVNVQAVDLDPSNNTLGRFEGLDVKRINTIDGTGDIDKGLFDRVVEEIASRDKDAPIVIDSGASNFIALTNYLKTNDTMGLLTENDRTLIFHVVIVGGADFTETVKSAGSLLYNFPTVRVVVWLNEYFGRVDSDVTESGFWRKYQDRIIGLVRLPGVDKQTFGKDVAAMFTRGRTFNDAIASSDTPLVSKHRLRKLRDAVYGELEALV